MIALPTRNGWTVEWETGKVSVTHFKNGRTRTIKWKDSYETANYQQALRKKAEKEKEGYKNVQIYECIF